MYITWGEDIHPGSLHLLENTNCNFQTTEKEIIRLETFKYTLE